MVKYICNYIKLIENFMKNYASLWSYPNFLINLVLVSFLRWYIYSHWTSELKHPLERSRGWNGWVPFPINKITCLILKVAHAQPNKVERQISFSNSNSNELLFVTVDVYVMIFFNETQRSRFDWQAGSPKEISVGYLILCLSYQFLNFDYVRYI